MRPIVQALFALVWALGFPAGVVCLFNFITSEISFSSFWFGFYCVVMFFVYLDGFDYLIYQDTPFTRWASYETCVPQEDFPENEVGPPGQRD